MTWNAFTSESFLFFFCHIPFSGCKDFYLPCVRFFFSSLHQYTTEIGLLSTMQMIFTSCPFVAFICDPFLIVTYGGSKGKIASTIIIMKREKERGMSLTYFLLNCEICNIYSKRPKSLPSNKWNALV